MDEVAFGILCLVIGSALIIWRKPFARKTIENQNRFWGFNFGELDVKTSEIVLIICGTFAIILGLSALLGVTEMKR